MAGPQDAPVLLLGPALGTSIAVWEPQTAELARRFRVVRFDLPGQGGAAAEPLSSIEELAGRVLDLADSLGAERFHYAGISLGGAIGAWLAVSRPERVESLAMLCSAARFGEPESWRERAALVRAGGTAQLVEAALGRWFTDPGSPVARRMGADLAAADPGAYANYCDALAAYDLRADLPRISAPTLILAGREDPATPPAVARELADAIPGATLVEIPQAAHLAGLERPEPVLAALRAHLPQPDGMRVRRAVLGDEHVDRAIANTTEFTADFQDFITRYAWGEIWTRPGLDRRTRSCITLTALVAGGHLDELAMHVRAALRNGLTPDEIKEVLLQTAVYCGVPAANAAFAVAQRALGRT